MKTKQPTSHVKKYTIALAMGWTVLIIASLIWNVSQIKKEILETAYIQAKVAFEKDLLYRRWNTYHGGVYVPVTEKTKPNPWLADIPTQEITMPSGKLLTLMNPAYMTREVYELEAGISDVRSHLTSLKPINPGNAPDPWERKALEAFELGEKEVASIDLINGKEYFRFIQPFLTEKGCLQCHARHGYKENDVRGGISVSIPMDPLWKVSAIASQRLTFIHAYIWIIGLIGFTFGYVRIRKSERKREETEAELVVAYTTIEKQVADQTLDLKKEIEEHNQAEKKIRDQLDELKIWQKVITDREQRNMDLKKEVNELLKQLGKPEKYES